MAGRKPLYDKLGIADKLELVRGWAREGDIEKTIAGKLGVGVSTITRWKNDYPEFAEALKKGKEEIDYEVENALLQSALGFYYTEETVTNQGEVVTIRKYQKPSTTAQIYWLKNRKYRTWNKDKVQIEHTGVAGNPIQFVSVWGGWVRINQ